MAPVSAERMTSAERQTLDDRRRTRDRQDNGWICTVVNDAVLIENRILDIGHVPGDIRDPNGQGRPKYLISIFTK